MKTSLIRHGDASSLFRHCEESATKQSGLWTPTASPGRINTAPTLEKTFPLRGNAADRNLERTKILFNQVPLRGPLKLLFTVRFVSVVKKRDIRVPLKCIMAFLSWSPLFLHSTQDHGDKPNCESTPHRHVKKGAQDEPNGGIGGNRQVEEIHNQSRPGKKIGYRHPPRRNSVFK